MKRVTQLPAAQGAGENRKGAVRDSTVTATRSLQRSDVGRSSTRVSSSAVEQGAAVRRPFAVFDIDGTLIRWQLYHAVADELNKAGLIDERLFSRIRGARMQWKRRTHDEAYKAYELELITGTADMLRNITPQELEAAAQRVFDEYKDQTYIYTRQLINELKAKDHILLAISGSPHEVVTHIAAYYGFDDFVAAQFVRENNHFTGENITPIFDKKAALASLVEKHGLEYNDSLAIGDSYSDIALLNEVEDPIAFNPEGKLFEHAKKQGWKIVVERKNMIYELEPKNGQYILAQTDNR